MAEPGELDIPWIDDPAFTARLAESDLAPQLREQVAFFAENGYLVLDLELPDFDAVAREIVRHCSSRPGYDARLMDAWEDIPQVRRLALLPTVLALLESLYRRRPIAMQTLNFGRGTEQRPHSDAFHFNSVPQGFMCGVWIALEAIDEDNGPLVYYPGSHRLPYLEHFHFGVTASEQEGHERYPAYEEALGKLLERADMKPLTLSIPAGHALVWSANLVHGGAPIRDPARTRHSQVTHYFFEDCLYYQPQRSDPFLGRVEWLDKRDVATGEYLPQIYNGRRAPIPMTLVQRLKRLGRRAGLARLRRRLRQR